MVWAPVGMLGQQTGWTRGVSGQELTGEEESHRGLLTTFTNSLGLNSPSISSHSKYCCLELYSFIVYKMLLQLYI